MNTERILSGARLLFRLWWPAVVFIGVCVALLLVFQQILFIIDNYRNFSLIGVAWLSLLVVYIILGVFFTRLMARRMRVVFRSVEGRTPWGMILLSGCPFYALCLLCLMSGIAAILDPNAPAAAAFFGVAGFVGFILVSVAYPLLVRLFIGRPTPIAQP